MSEFIYKTTSDEIKNILDDDIKVGDADKERSLVEELLAEIEAEGNDETEIEIPNDLRIQALIDFRGIPEEEWEEIEDLNFNYYRYDDCDYFIIDEDERDEQLRQIAEQRAQDEMYEAVPEYLQDYFDLARYTDDIEENLDPGGELAAYDGDENEGRDENGDTWYIYQKS